MGDFSFLSFSGASDNGGKLFGNGGGGREEAGEMATDGRKEGRRKEKSVEKCPPPSPSPSSSLYRRCP